ncbi:hypothetical protein PMG11_03587 [Penicillium brasilianum]|uniref:Azaphilone pigments biosynthesis cluster protein L N-terminal domain-containing protein n=1 Tax=Penicillium brasilianum TaxID=104259 RepID=A0A0F7VHV5_PENBI|nr:hypothetical protein PMG11_03587 [Penicillium brasilianum]
MTDPLSAAASIVGIVMPALHISRLLLDDLKAIKDAPTNIKTLTGDIESLDMALTSIKSIEDNEWDTLGPGVLQNAKATITSSADICKRFSADVQRWTSRSKDGSLSWVDRSNIGFLKKTRLTSMSGEIQTCQTKITSVVGIATFLKTIRQGQSTEEIRQLIMVKQGELVTASREGQTEVAQLEDQLKVLSIVSAPEDEEYQETLKQLKEQQKTLAASQRLIEELVKKLQESTRQPTKDGDHSIYVTFGGGNNGMQMGVNHGAINFTPKARSELEQ